MKIFKILYRNYYIDNPAFTDGNQHCGLVKAHDAIRAWKIFNEEMVTNRIKGELIDIVEMGKVYDEDFKMLDEDNGVC